MAFYAGYQYRTREVQRIYEENLGGYLPILYGIVEEETVKYPTADVMDELPAN